jgi:hypothetical protein
MLRKIGIGVAIAVLSLMCIQLGQKASIPGMHGVVSSAEARIGRPLTPVSVAGVARRTVRRCAVGVYNC